MITSNPDFAVPGPSIHWLTFGGEEYIIGLEDLSQTSGTELSGFWSAFVGIFKKAGGWIGKGVKFIFKGRGGGGNGDFVGPPEENKKWWQKLGQAIGKLAQQSYIYDERCGTYWRIVQTAEGRSVVQLDNPPQLGLRIRASSLPFWNDLIQCERRDIFSPGLPGATGQWWGKYWPWVIGGGGAAVVGLVLLRRMGKKRR